MKIYAEENGELNAYKREVKVMKLNLKIMDDKLKRRDADLKALEHLNELLQIELKHHMEALAFYEEDDSNVVSIDDYQEDAFDWTKHRLSDGKPFSSEVEDDAMLFTWQPRDEDE